MMDQIKSEFIEPSRKFAKDSYYLMMKCTKPDRKGKFDLALKNKERYVLM
jgi:hypothetical protein